MLEDEECILDTCRFFDEANHQWGYKILCMNPEHKERECPGEREIIRLTKED